MNAFFEVSIRCSEITEEGKVKKHRKKYLLDSVSFSEAEARIIEELKEMIQGDFCIEAIKKSNITEVVDSNDANDDKWFKAKVAIIDCDSISGKEKRANQYFLVAGSDVDKSLENLQKSLSTYVVPFEIVQVGDSNIMDVFPYFEDKQE